MRLDEITIGMNAIINKLDHRYDGYDSKVLSIYSDYADSKLVNIRVSVEEGDATIVVGRLKPENLIA